MGLLFGGTGKTGQAVAELTAKDDSHVFLVTRKPDDYKGFSNDNVTVIACNIFDADSISKVITDNKIDTVMTCLGFEAPPGEEMAPGYLRNSTATIEGMKKTDCKRYIMIDTWWSDPASRQGCGNCCALGCFMWCTLNCLAPFLARIFLGHHKAVEYVVANAGDIDYTICRAPILEMASAPPNKQGFDVKVGQEFMYVPGVNYYKGSREDLARFMVESIDKDEYKKQVVAFGREKSSWHCCCC